MSTSKEIQFSPEELIISKTDTNGNITYANRLFMRVCNYSEDELLGKPHNLIRHSEMPKGRRYAPRSALTAVQDIYSHMIQLERTGDRATAARNSWQWLSDYCAKQPGQAYDAFILTHYQNNK